MTVEEKNAVNTTPFVEKMTKMLDHVIILKEYANGQVNLLELSENLTVSGKNTQEENKENVADGQLNVLETNVLI